MIFYFSATGNCLDISNRLALALGDEKRSITNELEGDCSYSLKDGERVGIIAPVHYYGLPLNVEEFIGRMSFDRMPYIYLVLTYGSRPAQAMERAEKRFQSCGYDLNGKMTVQMPENYILMFDPPSEAERKRILSNAYRETETFASAVLRNDDIQMTTAPRFRDRIVGSIARPLYDHGRGTGRFYVDGTCTGCGRCVRMCPSKAIELIDRIPTWTKSKCLRCSACINRCPFHALHYGRSSRKRERYVNPNIDPEEL